MNIGESLQVIKLLCFSFLFLFANGYGLHGILLSMKVGLSRKTIFGIGFLGLNSLTACLSYWSGFGLLDSVLVVSTILISLSLIRGAQTIFAMSSFRPKSINQWMLISSFRLQTIFISISVVFPMTSMLFFSNIKSYIGNVNPDYLQSISLLDVFKDGDFSFYYDFGDASSFSVSESLIPNEKQARFSAIVFAHLVSSVFSISSLEALNFTLLILSIILGLTLIALFEKFLLSANEFLNIVFLFGIFVISSTTMSFSYMFVGQNSILYIFPLFIIALHGMQPHEITSRLPIISFLLFGVLYAYIPVFPVLSAIVLITLFFHMFCEGSLSVYKIRRALLVLAMTIMLIAMTILSSGDIFSDYLGLLQGLKGSETNFLFEDWLSPLSLPYFFGLTTSPFPNSFISTSLSSNSLLFLFLLSFVLLVILASQAVKACKVRNFAIAGTLLSLVLIALAYTLVSPSGWSLFKLSAWFGTIIGFLVFQGIKEMLSNGKRQIRILAIAILSLYISLNFSASLELIGKLRGENRQTGTFVNSYGFSTQYDFSQIKKFIDSREPSSKFLLVTGFVESILLEQNIPSLKRKTYLASHTTLPVDDKYMIDGSGFYVDAAGIQKEEIYPWRWDGAQSIDYVIALADSGWNGDIVENPNLAPLYSDRQFNVYDFSRVKTFVFTGRGFSRQQYSENERYSPAFRTAHDGFELFIYSREFQNVNLKLNIENLNLANVSVFSTFRLQLNNQQLRKQQMALNGRNHIDNLDLEPGLNKLKIWFNANDCQQVWNLSRKPIWCPMLKFSGISLSAIGSENTQLETFYNQISFRPGVSTVSPYSWFGILGNGWVQKLNEVQLVAKRANIETCKLVIFRDGGAHVNDIARLFVLNKSNLKRLLSIPIPVGENLLEIDFEKFNKPSLPTIEVHYGGSFLKQNYGNSSIPPGSIQYKNLSCFLGGK